ncbi:MAG: bacillithiol biosynthesis cysteine-adding enzyme BshC [Anaerolineae bacterium]|nr:bacillithiol biosynthesis cysteine-adding enzyme BshC [Anaerolineae bacterium]
MTITTGIQYLDFHTLPAASGNRLYLDYIDTEHTGKREIRTFFTHGPLDFAAALRARQAYRYPRQEIAERLAVYNARLGAHPNALANCDALAAPATFCVTTGQQAGFLGGPAYTPYKIITAIRLATQLQTSLGVKVVPIFWLATEDHDFGEINHADYVQRDGEIGRVGFEWEEIGRPIADLPLTDAITRACDAYFTGIMPGPGYNALKVQFAPRSGEDYCTWCARIWVQAFSEYGLVVVRPELLRSSAGEFLASALRASDEIRYRLDVVSKQLRAAGYAPALTSAEAGQLFTFDTAGRRVRIADPAMHIDKIGITPESYSTDAALRPLLADTTLPVLASVLGPGEIAYQAMLKPLYALFDLPQPLLFPRKSYTIVSQHETERLAAYQTGAEAVLREKLDVDAAFQGLFPVAEAALFTTARAGMEAALAPLQGYLESIDPSLGKTWGQTQFRAIQGLDKLEERAIKARMSQLRLSKAELHALRNVLLPKGNLQERVFPLPHYLNQYGSDFIDALFSAGNLDNFAHHIIQMHNP